MAKKIFAISTFLLVLLVGAIFVYNFAFKSKESEKIAEKTIKEGKTNETKPAPAVKTETKKDPEGIAAISDDQIFGAVLSPSGKSIYYFSRNNGQLDQVDLEGKLEKVISTEEFTDIKNIIWNKPKNQVFIEQKEGNGGSKFSLLDLTQKKITPLKPNTDSVAWLSLGDRIIYKYFDSKTKQRTINISDPDGSNWQKIADTDYFGVKIGPVPGSTGISFWPTPDAFLPSVASVVGLTGENKKEILKDRYGADILWSPDGTYAAVSYTDEKGGKKTDLALMNPDGGQFQSLNFPTFAEKCVWSADAKYIFCAMPGNIPETSILPNDWQDGKILTSDTFWKIERATGKKERLVETSEINGSFDASAPFLSQDEKILFFTNKTDRKLYKLGL